MIEIKDLLVKWDNLLLSEEIKNEAIKNVLHQIIGVSVDNKDIKIKNNIIYLNIKPIYKSEILLKKDKISNKLQEFFGKRAPEEIR